MILLLSLWSCTGKDAPLKDTSVDISEEPSCFDAVPSIDIGEGERAFEPFVEPFEAMMIHGPQGGWHILASLQTHGMNNIVEVHYTIEHLDSGVLVSDNTYRLAVVSTGDCAGYYPGMYGYLSVASLYDGELDTPPELLGGDALRIEMEVTDCTQNMEAEGICDRNSRWVSASMDVQAILDPVDIEDTQDSDTGESSASTE